MVQISIRYGGQKHCDLTHGPSGSKIGTDAPKDNNGKGELFSPTDLVAAALGSCMLTVMGIAAEKEKLSLEGAYATVDKEMGTQPRRITSLISHLHLPKAWSLVDRQKMEAVALGCPVKQSLHPEMQIPVHFTYDV